MHIKISRKESKESKLWLKHVLPYGNKDLERERLELIPEAIELENIFGSIYRKLEMIPGVYKLPIQISDFDIRIFKITLCN